MNTTTEYAGIDYAGRNPVNRDKESGIRYGVIAQNSIMPEAIDDAITNGRDLTYESAVSDFKRRIGAIECQEDLAELIDEVNCKRTMRAEDILINGALPLSQADADAIWSELEDSFNDSYSWCDSGERDWLYESNGYKITNCLSSDVMILASPFYTYARLCSPCVPGAGDLDSPLHVNTDAAEIHCICRDHGIPKSFCLGHDWFDGGKAPYRVFSVETNEEILP